MTRYRMVPSEHIVVAVERTTEDGRIYRKETIINAATMDAGSFAEGFLMDVVGRLRGEVAEAVKVESPGHGPDAASQGGGE